MTSKQSNKDRLNGQTVATLRGLANWLEVKDANKSKKEDLVPAIESALKSNKVGLDKACKEADITFADTTKKKTAGIGVYARELLTADPSMPHKVVLEHVLAKFPEAQTSVACIAWYKSDMNKKAKAAAAGN